MDLFELLVPPYNLYLIAVLLVWISWVIVLKYYLQFRYRAQFYMAISWYCLGFFYLTNVLAYLFDNSFALILISTYSWIPDGDFYVAFNRSSFVRKHRFCENVFRR